MGPPQTGTKGDACLAHLHALTLTVRTNLADADPTRSPARAASCWSFGQGAKRGNTSRPCGARYTAWLQAAASVWMRGLCEVAADPDLPAKPGSGVGHLRKIFVLGHSQLLLSFCSLSYLSASKAAQLQPTGTNLSKFRGWQSKGPELVVQHPEPNP